MNRLSRLLTTLTILAAAAAFAALPPQHQRSAELGAIAHSYDIAEQFWAAGVLVDAITLIDNDIYLVTGGDCELTVTIVDVPSPENAPPMVGPRNFELQLSELSCS